MTDPHIKVKIIPQLKDNYSYVIYSDEKKLAAIVDPAESASIINFIQSENVIDGFDFRDTSVSKSLLRATETEPWDQWCFDL